MNSQFRANAYELHAQRHVYPLYMLDGSGGYEFSSTMTFVRYEGNSFCIFAAHAIPPKADSLADIGVLRTDGEFWPLSSISISHKVCRERDLVACRTIGPFESKNYFELDVTQSSTEFSENFEWIGFPKKKALEKIHRTKASSEHVKAHLVNMNDGRSKWTNAEFLLLGVRLESESEAEVLGLHENHNVKYAHEGFKQVGYSLKGMSGGAFFRRTRRINTNSPRLSDFFQFVGIGLEYRDNRMVKGASRRAVQGLIEEIVDSGDKLIHGP